MRNSSRQDISQILRLMNEDMNIPGSTENLTGARYAQEAELRDLGTNSLQGFTDETGQIEDLTIGETYTDKEIKIGRRFVELMGSHERARDLLDKIVQSDQIFGVTDEENDANQIEQIASNVPEMPDLATNFSARFDPSSYR